MTHGTQLRQIGLSLLDRGGEGGLEPSVIIEGKQEYISTRLGGLAFTDVDRKTLRDIIMSSGLWTAFSANLTTCDFICVELLSTEFM